MKSPLIHILILTSFLLANLTTPAAAAQTTNSQRGPGLQNVETARIGLNAGVGAMDYDPSEMFADIMKTFREISHPYDNTPAQLDANGWPSEDCKILVWHGIPRQSGIYHLKLIGHPGDISVNGSGVIQNIQYDALTDTTTAKLVMTDPTFLYLTFTGTGSGVRDIQLMLPGHNFGERWNHDFLKALEPVRVIRFMDFTATNFNIEINWSDRTQPNAASQQSYPPGFGWQGRGIAWEYVIDLLNTTGADGWINIPAEASDAYIASLIDLIKNGGNGFAPLDPSRRLYIEYSNEVWNSGFDQTLYNHTQAVAEVNAGGSPLNFDGESNDWYWAWRRVAKRIVEISNQFRAAFGDQQMMTRFRPVLAWQVENGQATGIIQLNFIQNYYGNSQSGYSDPHPVDYYLWGGGGALYSDDIPLAQDTWWKNALRLDSTLASAFGINYVNYEGGIGFDGDSDPQWGSDWVRQDTIDRQQFFEENGGSLLMFYTLAWNYDSLGFLKNIRDLNTPKYKAFLTLTQQAHPWKNTYGASLPLSADGAEFSLSEPGWLSPGTGASSIPTWEWRAYHFNAADSGVYKVWVEYRSNSAIDLNIFAGSEKIATLNTNSGGSAVTSANYEFTTSAGLKAIRVVNFGPNTFDLVTVHVELVQAFSTPVVSSITRADPNPSTSSALHFNVLFSESVSTVEMSDFKIVSSGLTGSVISSISGSGAAYSLTVDPGSGNGSLRLDLVDTDSIHNLAGNPLGGPGTRNGDFTSGETYTIDHNPAPFKKNSPPNISAQGINPVLSWNGSNRANTYEVCLNTSPSCSTWITNGSATQKTLANLIRGQTYYWQVRAVNSQGVTYANGSSSALWSFTVTRQAHFSSIGPADGWLLESNENSGRGGPIGNNGHLLLGDDTRNRQYRSLLSFNTASLPDTAHILKVTLLLNQASLSGTNPYGTHAPLTADIRSKFFGTASMLQPEDFQAIASFNSIGNFTTSGAGLYQLTLKPASLSAINNTGLTQFRLRFSLDDDNDFKTDLLRFYSGDASFALRPLLTIEYSLP